MTYQIWDVEKARLVTLPRSYGETLRMANEREDRTHRACLVVPTR